MCLQILHKATAIKTKEKKPELPYVQMKEKYISNKQFANNTYPLICTLQVEFTTSL